MKVIYKVKLEYEEIFHLLKEISTMTFAPNTTVQTQEEIPQSLDDSLAEYLNESVLTNKYQDSIEDGIM